MTTYITRNITTQKKKHNKEEMDDEGKTATYQWTVEEETSEIKANITKNTRINH